MTFALLYSIALAVLVCNCSHWAATGRVVDRPCVHVGVRPAADAADEWAFTIQVTHEWGPCERDGGARP